MKTDLQKLLADLEAWKYDGYAHVDDAMAETSPEVQYAKGFEDGVECAMRVVRTLLEKA